MGCSCSVDPVAFAVPDSLRECAPDGADAATICPTCLDVEPAPESSPTDPAFDRISDAFPDGEGGVALALALGLLDSLALNRSEIETALEAAERAGADPLLAIDRLIAAPNVDPRIDLERRRDKVESLLY